MDRWGKEAGEWVYDGTKDTYKVGELFCRIARNSPGPFHIYEWPVSHRPAGYNKVYGLGDDIGKRIVNIEHKDYNNVRKHFLRSDEVLRILEQGNILLMKAAQARPHDVEIQKLYLTGKATETLIKFYREYHLGLIDYKMWKRAEKEKQRYLDMAREHIDNAARYIGMWKNEIKKVETYWEYMGRTREVGRWAVGDTYKACEMELKTARESLGTGEKKTFLRDFLVIGQFPNPGGRVSGSDDATFDQKGFDIDYLGGEAKTEPQEGKYIDYQEKRYTWKKIKLESDKLDFIEIFGPKEHTVAYAYTQIESDKDKEATIHLGSDDGYKLWVNGALVGYAKVYRGAEPDQNSHKIHLRKGKNVILVKVEQDIGAHVLYLRIE